MVKKTKSSIRILIAEDCEVVLYGLKAILNQRYDIDVIGEVSSCKEVLTLISTLKPDVILLDLNLNDGNSLDCITQLKKHYPDCKVLIYTASSDKKIHINALCNGAAGVLLKNQSTELLCKAIRCVHLNDELWVDKTLTAEMWKQHAQLTHKLKNKAYQFPISTTISDK